MREALNRTGRRIYYSICEWGAEDVATWAGPVGNSWRTTGDIIPTWISFLSILDKQEKLYPYAGPGGWNDPDMLEVGNGILTQDEAQSHFSLWATLKAPLLIGCALKGILNSTLSILANQEVIAVNQDKLGQQAQLLVRSLQSPIYDVWGGELSGDRVVLAFLNRGVTKEIYTLPFSHPVFKGRKVVKIREIVDKIDVVVPDQQFKTKEIRKHAVGHYIFTLASSLEK